MNSNPSFRLLVLAAVLVVAAGAAGAVTVSQQDTPREAEADSKVSATLQLTELYKDPSYERWTIEGETELTNVTWTVQTRNQAGEVIDTSSADGQTVSHGIDIESGAADVTVEVTGTAPSIENFTYDPAESFLVLELRQVRQGGTSQVIETYEAHHYTEDSRTAREAIEAAEAAIDDAGGQDEAERLVDDAISFYNAEQFDKATEVAERAEERASNAQQNQERTRLLLFGAGGLVVVVAVVGGFFWYRSKQSSSRL